jgi:hypothetical protein
MYPCKHLALSRVLFFLFDPTQHPKFRKACQGLSSDPQMRQQKWVHQQHHILLEAANRIRNNVVPRMSASEKYSRPLVVVVTKFDAWARLLQPQPDCRAVVREVRPQQSALDGTLLKQISDQIRGLLSQHAEEVVAAAEGFFREVIYIPVSALGRAPEVDTNSGGLVIRPRDIAPRWVELPMLYALHLSTPRLIPVGKRPLAGAQPQLRPAPMNTAADEDARPMSPDDMPQDPQKKNLWPPLKETGS